jgi:polyisoprenoid-binding protein YceI
MKAQLAGLCMGLLMASPAFAATYTFTEKSEVKFVATAPMRWNGVHGVSHSVGGKIELPDGKFEAAQVGISVPITSFEAKSGLDQHAFTALEAGKYPAAMFKSQRIAIESKTETPDGLRLTGQISGLLNFHGIVRPMTAPFTALLGPDESTFDTEFRVSLSDHQVAPITVLIITMDDAVSIRCRLVATTLSAR